MTPLLFSLTESTNVMNTQPTEQEGAPSFKCCTSSLIGVSHDGRSVKVIPLYCHKWNCPRCRVQKSHRWRQIACAGKPNKFITLTLRKDEHVQPLQQARRLKTAWTELVRRIRKKYLRFEYLLIMELTKLGTPHCHIIARCDYIPQGFLSDEWNNLTGAFKVDIRQIKRTSDVARYITKYMGKSIAAASEALQGLRIIQKSKGFVIDEEFINKESKNTIPHDVAEWTFIFLPPLEAVEKLSQLPGFIQLESDDKAVWQFKPPPLEDLPEYLLHALIGERAFRESRS